MSATYFSERERGPRPRTEETLSERVKRALLRQIEVRIGNGAFGWKFPEECDDGRGPFGTDAQAFWDMAVAEVPDLPIPEDSRPAQALQAAEDADTVVFLDLLEFCARVVARPIERDYHSFFEHYHLDFDHDAGLAEFVEDVNRLLGRNGIALELGEEGDARRIVAVGLREELRAPDFNTGDEDTDRLLDTARRFIVSPHEHDRRDALHKLWDAFERIKTIEPGPNKRTRADRLLDRTAQAPKLRGFLGDEARALTEIGNALFIRHSETTQERVQKLEEIDYLFHRMFSFLRLVLRATGRGG